MHTPITQADSIGYFVVPNQQLERLARVFLIVSFFVLPISTAATNVFMGLTLIAWLGAGGYRTRLQQWRGHEFAYAVMILFLTICAGSIYSTGSQNDILYQIHKYIRLLFILPAITLLQDRRWQQRALLAFSAAMLLTLSLSLISVIWPLSFVLGTANGPSNNHFVFKDHIAQNLMMSFFALIVAVAALSSADKKKKIFLYVIAALAIIDILFFVAGRTGFLSLAFTAIVFLWFLPSVKQKFLGVLAIGAFILLAIGYSDNVKGRMSSAVTEYQAQDKKELTSVGQRIEFLKKSVQLIKERPLLGFGTGSYSKEFCRVADSHEWCEAGKFHPHNQFLAFGVQLGIAGIAAYLMLIAAAVRVALQQSDALKACGIGLIATLIADSITHAPLFLVTESQFFILLFSAILATQWHREQTSA